jgi:hypothetical protein
MEALILVRMAGPAMFRADRLHDLNRDVGPVLDGSRKVTVVARGN